MNATTRILQPCFAENFRCLASDCGETCCGGWRITVDRDTFDRCRDFPDSGLRQLLQEHLVPWGATQENHAEIKLLGSACPFLSAERLCRLQQTGGESYLSVTCANYPRNFNLVDGILERTLDLSCPEAARLALLAPGIMEFSDAFHDASARTGRIPTIGLSLPRAASGLHEWFGTIRGFSVSLLQNRDYSLEDRLILLGRYCTDLQDLAATQRGKQAAELTCQYEDAVGRGAFAHLLASIPDEPAAHLKTLVLLLEHRMKTESASPRFRQLYEQFRQGIAYTNYLPESDLKRNYSEIKKRYFDGFIARHGYMLEHYFVNHAFKTLFPLGPQACGYPRKLYMIPKSIFEEYMALAIQYALLKNLLIGLSGYHEGDFSAEQALTLIQSFAKNIDHDIPYQQRLLQFFEENNMMSFACAAMLIKN